MINQVDQLALPTSKPPYSPIRADVENYLLNTYAWQLSQENIVQEFREVIYDPAADPGTVRRELEKLGRNHFIKILQQRGLLTQSEIQRVADQLDAVRQNVLVGVIAAEEREIVQDLQQRIESYLLVTNKDDLTPTAIQRDFKSKLPDLDHDYPTLSRRLALINRQQQAEILLARHDIQPEEAEQILDELERQRDRILAESQTLAAQAQHQAENLLIKIESYLRNAGISELNPYRIGADLKKLVQNPETGIHLSNFPGDTLVQLLNQRQDLTEAQIEQIIHVVAEFWDNLSHTPEIVIRTAQAQYDSVINTITDYLHKTGKEELNPEGIQRDLQILFAHPGEGIAALSRRLSQVDRDTLVKLLSQRQDLSEAQVNEIINAVQTAIANIIRAPRRLATRTQQRFQNFQAYLQEYLRRTGKAELNPESIKRDVQLLLHDPRVGIESISDRLAHFDRETIIALLKIREDITDIEAMNIADTIITVREQFVAQVRGMQRRIQEVIDGIFIKIRHYLNSLDRPELNYDSIKQDVRTLLEDPQSGFEALRDRLSSFNRDTLIAILSSRDDISQEDAQGIIEQIERVRNKVLERAERLQTETQQRIEEMKQQAQRQAEETRKAAATAAWWLFATAFVSAIFSALGGAIAVVLV